MVTTGATHDAYCSIHSFETFAADPTSRLLFPQDTTSSKIKPARVPIDFSALCIGQLQSFVRWTIGLVDLGPVDAPDDAVVDKPTKHHFLLLCDDTPRLITYMWTVVGVGPPPATVVLDFIRHAFAAWAPRPLPALLHFTAAFMPYAARLAPVLATLPAPMTYDIHSLEGARANTVDFTNMANSSRQRANEAYAGRDREAALMEYTFAVATLTIVLVEGHGAAEMARARTQLAVCLANRAAAYLLEGPGMDAQRALREGMGAERADASYVKGYLRQMRAHLLLGDVVQARSALERASRQARGADVQIVADALAALSKTTTTVYVEYPNFVLVVRVPAIVKVIRTNRMKIIADMPPNPKTGSKNPLDIFTYIAENANRQDVRALYGGTDDTAERAQLDVFDFAALAPTVVPGTMWRVGLIDRGDIAFHFPLPSGHFQTIKVTHRTTMECRDEATGTMRFQQDLLGEDAVLSDYMLTFLRRCVAMPAAPQEPALPATMILSDLLAPHLPVLEPFLNSLPPPFTWQVAGPAPSTGPPWSEFNFPTTYDELIALAKEMKDSANEVYEMKFYEMAVQWYRYGIEALSRAEALEPERMGPPERRLRAVLHANRAAAHLGNGNAGAALQDGLDAEQLDPSYLKGYIRQARAHEVMGDKSERRTVLERALGCVNAVDMLVVRRMLDS
ncbi:hypothetical protein FA95DRAFT_1595755 [Auriscalpium vulgare]|uniref:Uncharacterized protein n=1 Tax=Auriscalpium vulgare TaxID=40419 RepID=A0ACB8RUQ2_9AGAM|nr:hypothetical protein FA95DRAFT_1595755 [Auriscalpium vulgare]